MATSPHDVAKALTNGARHQLTHGMAKIEHCVAQLGGEQLWWRPRPEMNSIANLMLHLAGNLQQWIVAGVGGGADVRDRRGEFADRSNAPKAKVLGKLKDVVAECDAILARLGPDELLARKGIQGFDVTVADAIFDVVPHFRGHMQEIIHLTRQQLGERYQFKFVPQTPEQISAGRK